MRIASSAARSMSTRESVTKTKRMQEKSACSAARPASASCASYSPRTLPISVMGFHEAVLMTPKPRRAACPSVSGVVDGEAVVERLEGEPPAEVLAERMIFGDEETCLEKLEQLRELVNPTRLICNVQLGALPHALVRRSLERFAERVAPRLAQPAAAII
jgi:alkanesulfonate monooxygenase SsuD/methylene tetrahydromethanopterin reductase-like flavin-dependent oxidoreductase (luciferase family)